MQIQVDLDCCHELQQAIISIFLLKLKHGLDALIVRMVGVTDSLLIASEEYFVIKAAFLLLNANLNEGDEVGIERLVNSKDLSTFCTSVEADIGTCVFYQLQKHLRFI